jgi:hypothetical protein
MAYDNKDRLKINATGQTIGLSVATFTRPADTNAYTANDAVANDTGAATLIDFGEVVDNVGDGGYITKAWLYTNQSTNTARFRLWLFVTDAFGTPNDNASGLINLVRAAGTMGYIDFPACAAGSGVAFAFTYGSPLNFQTQVAANTKHLFGYLQTLDAFTPVSGQLFGILLGIEKG